MFSLSTNPAKLKRKNHLVYYPNVDKKWKLLCRVDKSDQDEIKHPLNYHNLLLSAIVMYPPIKDLDLDTKVKRISHMRALKSTYSDHPKKSSARHVLKIENMSLPVINTDSRISLALFTNSIPVAIASKPMHEIEVFSRRLIFEVIEKQRGCLSAKLVWCKKEKVITAIHIEH